MRLHFVIAALVATGCVNTRLDSGTGPQVTGYYDGSVDEHDERTQDGGLVIDEPPPMFDAGRMLDAGPDDQEHPGPDSGHPLVDAAVGDDGGEDAGAIGPIGMCSGELAEPATFGTAQEPIELAASVGQLDAQIDWRGRAFVRITGVTPGTRYVIAASAASKLALSAFTEDTTFTDAACVAGDQVNEFNSLCSVTAVTESIDVAVDALYRAEPFTLLVRPAYAAEGTLSAPIQIAGSALPYELEVSSDATNFYEIAGLTPSVPYAVSVRDAFDYVVVGVYEVGAFGTPTDQNLGGHFSAIGTPLGTSLIVSVRAWGSGTTAVLDIEPATHESEGTASEPIEIAASALPFEGDVGWSYSSRPRVQQIPQPGGSESFYRITGIAPGGYVLKLDGATSPVFAILDDDGSMSSAHLPHFVHASGRGPARLATRITGSTLDVLVKNQGGEGTSFTLDLQPAAHASVGTEAAPLQIRLADFPYSGEVEPNIYSYYEVTGLTPGQHYLARATNVTEAAVGIHFPNSMPFTPWDCEIQAQTGTSDQTCTFLATEASFRFQARVFGYAPDAVVGSVFTLSLRPITEESVGTAQQPVAIECASGTYTGQIGTDGYSYYEIAGLEPGAAYLVEAKPHDDDIVINVFTGAAEDPFSDSTPCYNYGSSSALPPRCVSTSAAGSLFVQVIGYARGQPFELSWRRSADASEGTQSTPVMLAATDLPYAGQVSGARPSFYAISGLVPGTGYVARIAPVDEQIDMHLLEGISFEDAPEIGGGPVYPGAPFTTTFIASGTDATLKVALPVGADGLSAFELDISAM